MSWGGLAPLEAGGKRGPCAAPRVPPAAFSEESPGPSRSSNPSRVPWQRPPSHVSDAGSGLRMWNRGQRLLCSPPSQRQNRGGFHDGASQVRWVPDTADRRLLPAPHHHFLFVRAVFPPGQGSSVCGSPAPWGPGRSPCAHTSPLQEP